MSFVWILIIGVAGMAGTLWLVTSWEQHRARLLKQAGMALGFRALEKGEPLAAPSVEIIRKRGRTIGAAIEGSWRGEPIMVFDLSYPAGKNVSRTTVFLLRLPQPRIPEFAAIRKNIWLYTPTVDLPRAEDAPASLRRHWLLYAPGGRWPLGDEINGWLGRNKNWSVEGRGSGLFVYQRAKRVPTKALEVWVDEAYREAKEFMQLLADTLPHSLTDDGENEPTVHKRVFTFKASFRI